MTELLGGTDQVVLLAAEHRDDVSPTSLYYDVNVGGMRNTLEAMDANGIKRIVFTSSVAIYGLNKQIPNEDHPADPFNHYGKSKWQAEQVLQEWHKTHPDWNIKSCDLQLYSENGTEGTSIICCGKSPEVSS